MAEANSTRVCTCCKIPFPATPEYFHAYKRAPDGCRAVCSKCRAADNKANNAAVTAKKRAHYQANKDRLLKTIRDYYAKNADAQRAAAIARHEKNRAHNLERMKAYRIANLDALNSRRRPKANQRFKKLYGTDLVFTLKHRTKSLIARSLRGGKKAGRRAAEVLGYSISDLKLHIEKQFKPGMNWGLFLAGDIHLDHILPIDFFKPSSIDSQEFRDCWALSNLQPMWAVDNLSKGAKIAHLL